MSNVTNWSANTFQVEIPEVYQLELTNCCNLDCSMCIRKDPRVQRPVGFMSTDLVDKMVSRGDFSGSYFVELQMYGEPIISPKLGYFIDKLQEAGLKVGLSTNGTAIKSCIEDILKLDYLTISVDTANKEDYEVQRLGSSFDKLIGTIDMMVKIPKRPIIDLQVINYWGGKDNLPGLVELAKDKGWNVTCRSVSDCFAAYQNRLYPREKMSEICMNPWLSVSVQYDGDVVPCCFAAGKDIVYGNLNDSDLRTIWNTSTVRQALMEEMRLNFNLNHAPCKLCYMRSPILFHLTMLMNNFKEGK